MNKKGVLVKHRIPKVSTLLVFSVLFSSLTIKAEAAVEKKSDIITPQGYTHFCASQPNGYIYDSKINSSCRESRKLASGRVCWRCNDTCTKKMYPYTEKECSRYGLEKGDDFCTTIDDVKRYKSCKCAKNYHLLSEINYDKDVFVYDDKIRETSDGKIKCYRALDCLKGKKITSNSGLIIKGNYAWVNQCSKLKIISNLKDTNNQNNFYCATDVECNKEFNCYKSLDDQDCVLKEKDVSLLSYYSGEDNTCYFYKTCLYSGLCIRDNSNDCINIKTIPANLYDPDTQKTKKEICYKFMHGKSGCLEGFSLTKKYLCTRFDRTPQTTDGTEVDSISYNKDERTVTGLTQSCRKYVECKFGYEEYKPESRGMLTAEDIEAAKEDGAYEVSYIKSVRKDKEDYIICRKFLGCTEAKCNVSCGTSNAWLKYFLPLKKKDKKINYP